MSLPTSVDLIVPYMPDGGLRDKHFHYLQAQWVETFPTMGYSFGEPATPTWNKAEAIHDALQQSESEVLVVADADVWVDSEYVVEAVRRVWRMGTWVMPHQIVYRLGAESSAQWQPRTKQKFKCERLPYIGVPGGGMFVIRREHYDAVPMDRDFVGHSGQDIAWAHAADTLLGHHSRLAGKLWHLHHPPQPTKGDSTYSVPNFRLMNTYARARSSKTRMRELVDSGRVL